LLVRASLRDLDIAETDCVFKTVPLQLLLRLKLSIFAAEDGELLRLLGAAKEQSVIDVPATPQNGLSPVRFSHAERLNSNGALRSLTWTITEEQSISN